MSIFESLTNADLIIVGAGFYGLTIAERSANEGFKVCIIEKRNHIGGNAFSYIDSYSEIEVHKYGTHIFHTSNKAVWEYINKFTDFNGYRHTVFTVAENKSYSLPINLATLSSFYGRVISPEEGKAIIEKSSAKTKFKRPMNLREKAISLVGEELYETFIRGYTEKQWGVSPENLPASIISRLPVRMNFNNRYFSDQWEGLPSGGYFGLFSKLVAHPLIKVHLNIDFFEIMGHIPKNKKLVYTGPVDRYFSYCAGELKWRTLDLSIENLDIEDFQGTAVINYADLSVPYTRIHEFKHLYPERVKENGRTTIMKEFSRSASKVDEPYYPVNTPSDRKILDEYRKLMELERNVIFGGRLGTYQYLDMHMAIGSALVTFEKKISNRKKNND